MAISYKDAGVDIDKANALIKNIKPIIKQSYNDLVLGDIGGFAGAYELPGGYKQPVLLAGTDGVGSKLKLAIKSGLYEGIGEDLVAMCVNDLLCSFAKPLFFLDYYASHELEIELCTTLISSIVKACKEADCALIGGESAEMPSLYSKGDFDLAGFCVGIAEKEEINRKDFIKNGDMLLALPSSGLHSNGYALATKVLFEELKLDFDYKLEDERLIDILMRPTKIYAKDFLSLKPYINACAHITGGGIVENLVRILPKGLGSCLQRQYLKTPAIFDLISSCVTDEEMIRSFNLGVGMLLVVSPKNISKVLELSNAYIIGELCLNEKVQII